MKNFLQLMRSRWNSGAGALVAILIVGLLNNNLSTDLTVGQLTPELRTVTQGAFYRFWQALSAVVYMGAVVLWALDQRHRLSLAVLGLNGLFTVQLFVATIFLVLRLLQHVPITVPILLRDGLIIFATNILTFALWYWFIDSDDTRLFREDTQPSWDFLFPQRQAALPGYEDWKPRFVDYVFLAYMTSVAFSPTDTAPLSRTAKMLMIAQSVISLIVIAVIAGTAINMLAGNA